jgi:hypothetical protein
MPPPTAQSPTCNTLFNTATWTLSTSPPASTPPSPEGGAFFDGIYACTALDTYGTDQTRERVRDTVVVTDQGTTFLWANDALDENTNMIETFRGNTTATFQETW